MTGTSAIRVSCRRIERLPRLIGMQTEPLGKGGQPTLLPPRPIVSMSLRRLFLGELLSSRARLRFTGCKYHEPRVPIGEAIYTERQVSQFCRVSLMGTTALLSFSRRRAGIPADPGMY